MIDSGQILLLPCTTTPISATCRSGPLGHRPSYPSFLPWKFQTSSVAPQSALYILSSQEEELTQITVLMEVMEGGRLMSSVSSGGGGGWWHELAEPSPAIALQPAANFSKEKAVDQAAYNNCISGRSHATLRSQTFCPFSCLWNVSPSLPPQSPSQQGNTQRARGNIQQRISGWEPGPAASAPPGHLLEIQIPGLYPTSVKHWIRDSGGGSLQSGF